MEADFSWLCHISSAFSRSRTVNWHVILHSNDRSTVTTEAPHPIHSNTAWQHNKAMRPVYRTQLAWTGHKNTVWSGILEPNT